MISSFIEILKCPHCEPGILQLKEEEMEGQEFVSGHLHCASCHGCYVIEEGIPCLLPKKLLEINRLERQQWIKKYREIENNLIDSDKDTFRDSFEKFVKSKELDEEKMSFIWEHRLF
jgi:uncharacterized protein YbaR (Trm112 family)